MKKKELPAALKTLENTMDKKLKTEIAWSSSKMEKKIKNISSQQEMFIKSQGSHIGDQ